MLLSFLNNSDKLTTGGIIAIVFFGIAVVVIIGLTIGFFVYKGHVKKIYSVERRLTQLLNNPIEKKIKRLSNIASTNDDFVDQVDDVKIIYANEIVRRLTALNINYQKAVASKKIWTVNKANSAVVNSYVVALDKIEAEINMLSTVVDILINTELSLRDDLVDFMQQWNTIEEHYETKKDKSDNQDNFISDEVIDQFDRQKNELLGKYDKAISNGDFGTVKEVYNKLNELGKRFLKETNLYPTHMEYFTGPYPEEKTELVDNNATSESVMNLKKKLDSEEKLVRESLDNNEYSKAIDGIDVIFDLLESFKHNRKLENAFELFIQSSGEELQKFFEDVERSLEVVKKEDSDEYEAVSEKLKDEVNKPIENIKKIVAKIEKETSKVKSDKDTLNDQRINFEDNLAIINRGLNLLKSIKTKGQRTEEDYINFLSEMLKAKSTLIGIKNLLANDNNGLSEADLLLDEKLVASFEEQLDKWDATSVSDFDVAYPSQVSKSSIIDKLKEMNKRLNSIYQDLQDSYRYYNLAVAIKIMYTDIKEPEYGPIWEKLLELFYKGKYKEFVQGYIRESEIQR